MQFEEKINIMNDRLSDWLKGHYGRHATKEIQCDFGVSKRAAEYALAGDISAPLFRRILAGFGAPLASFIFQPSNGTEYPSHLDTIDHDLRSAAVASSVALRQGLGLADPRHWVAAGDGVRNPGSIGDLDAETGVPLVRSPLSKSTRDLLALCGRLEQHEVIPLESADPRHAQLLEVWRSSGGVLTEGFVLLLDRLGLAELVSIYTSDIKVRQIGADTIFWTETQRNNVVGKPVFEIPAPLDFTRAVHERLSESVRLAQPTNTILTFSTGVARATWKRMSFPFLDGVLASPALQVAV